MCYHTCGLIMKKLSFLLLFILFLNVIASHAVYNKKSVKDYKLQMEQVQKTKKSYTMEVRQSLSSPGLASYDLYHKAYLKNGKWKAETSNDGGKTYPSSILFDGKNCYMYWTQMAYGIKIPDISLYGSNKASNPVDSLFYWDGNGSLFNINDAVIVNNNAKMNGYNCRLIKMGDFAEACISDELGIAVYYKLKSTEPLTGAVQNNILNVVKVNTSDIPDSVFKLPQGINLMDYNEQF